MDLHGLGWIAGHHQNFLEVTFYPTLLVAQMPTKHRFIECRSWKGPPGPSEPSFSSYSHCSVEKWEQESDSIPITWIWWYRLLCRTLQWQPKVFSWCDHASWFAQNSPVLLVPLVQLYIVTPFSLQSGPIWMRNCTVSLSTGYGPKYGAQCGVRHGVGGSALRVTVDGLWVHHASRVSRSKKDYYILII